jgi:hypothetical protein
VPVLPPWSCEDGEWNGSPATRPVRRPKSVPEAGETRRTDMDLATARIVLLHCTLINFGILAFWGVLMLLPHDWIQRLWMRRVPKEQFEATFFGGLLFYKILVIVFNLVPYLALLMA